MLRLDSVTRRVSVYGHLIGLGPTEFRLLKFLMTHPETVHSRTHLIQSIWDKTIHVEERTIDVHVRHLRKALEPFGLERLIQTVRSVDYRLSSQ